MSVSYRFSLLTFIEHLFCIRPYREVLACQSHRRSSSIVFSYEYVETKALRELVIYPMSYTPSRWSGGAGILTQA